LVIVVLLVFLLCLAGFVLFVSYTGSPIADCLVVIVLVIPVVWLVYGELRTKAISVVFDATSINYKPYLGVGGAKEFCFKHFDCCVTSVLTSEYESYEYLYLMKDNKKVIKLSEFYHKNYSELKEEICNRVEYTGEIPFSLRDELKEIFQ